MGQAALQRNTTGSNNVALGKAALNINTTGGNNVAMGAAALYSNTSGCNNIALGQNALQDNISGCNNIALGSEAMVGVTGCSNVFAVNNSGATGAWPTGATSSAFYVASIAVTAPGTTGANILHWDPSSCEITHTEPEGLFSHPAFGDATLAVILDAGHDAAAQWGVSAANFWGPSGASLNEHHTGTGNTVCGYDAMNSNTTGSDNVAMGYEALQGNTTGCSNVAMGYEALSSNTTGGYNVALGQSALYNNITGSWNIALGMNALRLNIGGNNNVALGATRFGAIRRGRTPTTSLWVLARSRTRRTTRTASLLSTTAPRRRFQRRARGSTAPSTWRASARSVGRRGRAGCGTTSNTGEIQYSTSKSFIIPHPEHEGKKLRHACIEAPTRGTNIYEYQFETTESNQITHVALPSYFKHINGRPRVYVSAESIPTRRCGYIAGKVNDELTAAVVETEHPGVFNVMVTGIRKDAGAVGYSATEHIDEPIAPEDIPPSQTVICCGSNYGKK